MPLNVLFWLMEAAFLLHNLDETASGSGFVKMMKNHFRPEFDAKKFFWFNAGGHVINIISIILYEVLGGAWVIFPLSISWLFVTNGLWHVFGTAVFKEYIPGLVTSPLYWIVMYFVVRYSFLKGDILLAHFVTSAVIGTILTVVMIGSLFIMRQAYIKKGRLIP